MDYAIAITDPCARAMRSGLRVEHAHTLEDRDERLVVLGQNVKHAVRHRLLVVAAHLRHAAGSRRPMARMCDGGMRGALPAP